MNEYQINHNEKWDVVIIGGGIAGLTASIYLAKEGKKVLILEKGSNLGGRGISKNIENAHLNLGPHALFNKSLEILNEVGVNVSGKPPKLSGSFVFGTNPLRMKVVEAFNLFLGNHLKWKEKMELIRFYSHIRKVELEMLNEKTLEQVLSDEVSSDRVKDLIKAFVRVATFINNPELVSARVAIEQLRSAKVLYLDHGWQSIVDQLIVKAKELGVTIQNNISASQINGSFPKISIGLKDGNLISTRCILSTINPMDLAKMIEDKDSVSAFIKKCQQIVPVRAACLDLVVSGLPNPKLNFALGVEQPWYFSNHSTVAKLSSNPGESVLHVMKYLNSLTDTDPSKDESELESLLDLIQPGWRDYVLSRRFLPKLVVSNAIKKPLINQEHDWSNPEQVGIEGIYVAGDWVGNTEILLNASLTSGKAATKRINERLALQLI
jgi:protoporphyrinogen oxidase